MTKIITFGYKKGVGKSTAAKFLTTYLRLQGNTTKSVSFASKLKDIAHQLYKWGGLQRGVYYETNYQEKEVVLPLIGKSPRQIWIELGNKVREIHPDTWIQCALQPNGIDYIIITDLRFPNEAKAIKEADGKLVKINRPNIPTGTDPAEIELDNWNDWDEVINNTGSLKDLNDIVINLLT